MNYENLCHWCRKEPSIYTHYENMKILFHGKVGIFDIEKEALIKKGQFADKMINNLRFCKNCLKKLHDQTKEEGIYSIDGTVSKTFSHPFFKHIVITVDLNLKNERI